MPIEKSGLGVVVRVGSRETYLGMPEWNEIGEHFAALRSDSPVREQWITPDMVKPECGFYTCRKCDELHRFGEKRPCWPPQTPEEWRRYWRNSDVPAASTGGERDEPDPYDIGYDTGFKDGMHAGRQEIPEGGIEVEVDSMLAAGKEWSKIYVTRSTPYIEPGSYVLLPRQVGDPNGGDDGE